MTQNHKKPPAPHPPGRGRRRPPPGERDVIIDAFMEILLAERGADTPCFLDSIFLKAELTQSLKQSAPDTLLTDLFLFEQGRMPRHTNLFNADCGLLTERLLTTLFTITRREIVDSSDASMVALEKESEALRSIWARKYGESAKFPKWKKADFLMGTSHIIECKYRFNSYDAKQKQIKIAQLYLELGLTPVFLHLSPDFQYTEQFRAAAWLVYSGQAMIDYVAQHTGYDFRELLRELSAKPVVRQRLLDAHKSLLERQKEELWRDYHFAPEDVKTFFAQKYATDKDSLLSLADHIEVEPPLEPDIVPEKLRDRTERLCDAATQTLPQDKRDALLGILLKLDEDQRAELLSEALSQSSNRTQMTVMSVFG